jgi:hypothetical protein
MSFRKKYAVKYKRKTKRMFEQTRFNIINNIKGSNPNISDRDVFEKMNSNPQQTIPAKNVKKPTFIILIAHSICDC